MKKILVPVDFSPNTDMSCNYAIKLAQDHDCEVVLFHSFFEQIYFSDGGFATGFESGIMLTDDIILDFYKQKEESLREKKEELERRTKEEGIALNISSIIETGDPQHQILNLIGKITPDIVVMGSSGMGKKSFLTGSVCKRVMDNCDTPVMAIPDIRQYLGVSTILYTTDIQQDDISALQKIFSLFGPENIHVHCLHLNLEKSDQKSLQMMEGLKMNAKLDSIRNRISFEVLSCKDPKKCLKEYIKAQQVQLIAFVPHKKNFFTIFTRQNLSKEDLFLTGLPILGIS